VKEDFVPGVSVNVLMAMECRLMGRVLGSFGPIMTTLDGLATTRDAKCAKIVKTSQSISIIIGALFMALVIATIIMFLVLRSKRRQKDVQWSNLSILSRAWYRVTEASNFGFIAILVLFVQILVELTHWDDYIFKEWAELSNGNSEGVGLICLLPTLLHNPFNSLLLRLMIPIIISVLLT
jgi:hypothetical protein